MSSSDPYAAARQRMLDEQLQARGIDTPKVLEAMARVPREHFVPDTIADEAYHDCALPIDCEQTISQPYIVGLMTQQLDIQPRHRVLEIGTGCGYQTAVLAQLAAEVYTIERHGPLSEAAQLRLAKLGVKHVHYRIGDGTLGWPEEAPFDRILITAAAPACPAALWEQLAEGGLLVAPFGPSSAQTLEVHHKLRGTRRVGQIGGCRFVPLISD